jgi:biotin transport system substrate-specific component
MKRQFNTKKLILAALFSALTAVCSIISVPLPFSPVPINMATLSVFLAGSLLGSSYGAASQLAYVFMGAIGLPVFHSFTGGLGILTGPTGGYLIGYIAAAYLIGLLTENKLNSYPLLALSLFIGLTACYAFGTLWFMYVTGSNIYSALVLCVIPFLPGDGIKILLALLLVKKIRSMLDFD